MSEKFDQKVVDLTRWVIKWRWAVIVVMLLFAGIIGSGGRFLRFDTSYRVFFSKDNPQLTAFEALQDIYTKNDNILFVFEPDGDDVFTPETLNMIEEFTADAWKIPYAIRVDAVTNFQHTQAFDDDLMVDDLIANALTLSSAEIEKARSVAIDEPQLRSRLISPETHVVAVNVTFQLPGKDQAKEVPEVVTYARNLANSYRDANPSVNIYETGVVMLNNAFSEAALTDMSSLIPAMYLVMILVMFVVLRTVSGTLATVLVIFLSSLTAMGAAGWLHTGLTAPSSIAPTMIMTLAIADSLHILITMLREMRRGLGKREAIVESIRLNMTPVFLTSLTTAIGFLSMNFSDAPPMWHLGNITSVGVIAAFLYSVLLLPALMAVLPLKARSRKSTKEAVIDRFAEFVIARRRVLLWGTGLTILLIAFAIPQNALNDQFVKYFDESVQFRRDTDFMVENLSGIYQVEFSLAAGESGGISNPEYLTELERFAAWLHTQPEVVHVNSFSEVMKRVNRSMHGDDENWYRVPESRELAAQYLLLYELSLPYGLDLNNQINVDKSATRFSVTLDDLSSTELREFTERTQDWLRSNVPDYMFSYGVGPAVMFAYISDRNIISMLKSTTAALILISFSLMLALRSTKFGLLSLLPNLVPATLAFGAWGLTVGEINMATSVVAGMTLGIIVDDTVHFLSKYLRARREKGMDSKDAVRYAFSTVGVALVVTSVILVAGFVILSFSAFTMNSGMGKLTALTIVFALLADFLFLPPLLMRIDKGESQKTAEPDLVEDAAVLVNN